MKLARKIMPVLMTAMCAFPAMSIADSPNFARNRNVGGGQRTPEGYQAIGYHAGGFTIYPALDLNLGHDSNIFYDNTLKTGDSYALLAPSLNLVSNWGRHALNVSAASQYTAFDRYSSQDTLAWNASAGGRLDFSAYSNLNAGLGLARNYLSRLDPTSPRNAARPIRYDTMTARLGTVLEFNRLRLTGALNMMRYDYRDTVDFSGHLLDQNARDFTYRDSVARADYAISPDTSVYVTYTANERAYRQSPSLRNSHGYNAAVGASFDLTHLITGEAQVGYLKQTYKNPAFKPTQGQTLKLKVYYYPTQLMTITATADKDIKEAPDANASGILSTSTSVQVDHELLRTLVLTAGYNTISDRYNGIDRHDRRAGVTLKANYLLTRTVSVGAAYTHSTLKSEGAAAIHPYADDAVTVALKFKY